MSARGDARYVEACAPMAFGPVGTAKRTLALRPCSFALADEHVEAFLARRSDAHRSCVAQFAGAYF